MPTDDSTPFPKKLMVLLALRLGLPLSTIFVLLFTHEPLLSTLFRIAMGGFFAAGMLLTFLTADRLLDWGTTPQLLAYVVILFLVIVPDAQNMYTLILMVGLVLNSWIAPWIARRLGHP